MNNITALLPMKANSERVKGKNFRILGDRPLFEWMLQKLIDIKIIDKIIINTDALNILEKFSIVDNEKVEIRERHHTICGDLVSMNKIINDDLLSVDSKIYLMTHTTNPLLSKSTIINAINTFLNIDSNKFDSLFSVNRLQSRFFDDESNPINHDPRNLQRTQDLNPIYEENSCMYIFTKESFLMNNKNRIGLYPKLYETPKNESFDIDDEDDWNIVKSIILNKNLS